MRDAVFGEFLREQGFRLIGSLHFRLQVSVWWHPQVKAQVLLVPVGSRVLLKGTKAYFLKSITPEGETWARDIGPLHEYLEAHFPELRLSFSFFRDVTEAIAALHLERNRRARTPTMHVPTVEHLVTLQHEMTAKRDHLQSAEQLIDLDQGISLLSASHERHRAQGLTREIESLERDLASAHEEVRLFRHLQQEYLRKGSAACFTFSISSNVHLATEPLEFQDALHAVVKELTDAHRFQVTQKLGGRLNIQVAEAEEPALTWIEEWFGGALSPRQLERLGPEFRLLRDAAHEHLMVTPDADVVVNGAVKEDQKLLAAWTVSSLVSRLDKPRLSEGLRDVPDEALPARVGRLIHDGTPTDEPCVIPLVGLNHAFISGTTGTGKSYLARVMLEEAAQHRQVDILVLDPRNQSASILVPEDREEILSRYSAFDLPRCAARGFPFTYYAPGLGCGRPMPKDLGELGRGRVIVSFKGLDDGARCRLFHQILDAVFEDRAREESPSLRQLIFVEEAHRFTRRRVAEEARAAGAAAENSLDRTVREGRKYGCSVVILSQSIRDFAYESASIRANTNTKIFLHNSDRELEYAADILGDGRAIIHLKPGTAILHNASWGTLMAEVRPPFSKVWEFNETETAALVADPGSRVRLSSEAKQLLSAVEDHYRTHGEGLNLSRASDCLGVTSKRKLLSVVQELERAGRVRTRKLRERGQPRIIEPILSTTADETTDGTRPEPGPKP